MASDRTPVDFAVQWRVASGLSLDLRRHRRSLLGLVPLAAAWFVFGYDEGAGREPLRVSFTGYTNEPVATVHPQGTNGAPFRIRLACLTVSNTAPFAVALDGTCALDTEEQHLETEVYAPAGRIRLPAHGAAQCHVVAPAKGGSWDVQLGWATWLRSRLAEMTGGLAFTRHRTEPLTIGAAPTGPAPR